MASPRPFPSPATSPSAATDDRLRQELDAIGAMSLVDLRCYWVQHWSGAPPAFRARDQLSRAIAHHLQTDAFGDLPGKVRRELADLAERFHTDRGFTPAPVIQLKPGSSIIREWGGKRHEVAVVDGGYLYDSVRYGSLSKVATEITGTKWNGPVFFGLKPRKAAAGAVAQARS